MANMDEWENEKKQQLKIVTKSGMILTREVFVFKCFLCYNFYIISKARLTKFCVY